MMGVTRLLIFILSIIELNAFIAYDCSHNSMNFTKVDITDIGPCKETSNNLTERNEEMQLVQLLDEYKIKIFSCKVEVHRLITSCGAYGHVGQVTGGTAAFIHKLGRDECMEAHRTGRLTINRKTAKPLAFYDIEVGKSTRKAHTFAGWTDNYGYCGGASYYDAFGTWDNVVVTGYATILLLQREASVNPNTNQIHLPNGLKCIYDREECDDMIEGESYWKSLSDDSCKTALHSVLYQGVATIVQPDTRHEFTDSVVTVTSDNMLFSLRIIKPYAVCGLSAYTTEHPKLIIVRKIGSGFHYQLTPKKADSLDLMTYMNSKFVFMERTISGNMKSLYNHIMQQKCHLEQLTLKTQLTVAVINPNEFAFLHVGKPGYTGTLLGEVIYISQCQPVEVSIRKSNKCYNELPVLYNNRSFYMTAKTHLLQMHGQEVTCNNVFSPTYKIDNFWYTIGQTIHETPSPHKIEPYEGDGWEYKSTSQLATAGIYSQEDLDHLREHIMYGPEREAIANVISRGFSGLSPDQQGGSMVNLLTEEGLENLSSRVGERIWGWFAWFGNLSSGIVGIVVVFRILKWIVDTVIHGTILYEVYGLSIKILGSVWDSLTWYLLHKSKQPSSTSGTHKETQSSEEPVPSAPNDHTVVIPLIDQSHIHEPTNISSVNQLYPSLQKSMNYNEFKG